METLADRIKKLIYEAVPNYDMEYTGNHNIDNLVHSILDEIVKDLFKQVGI